MRHTHRTAGFFKVRGINLAHAELEDFLFSMTTVNDFKAEAMASEGLDYLRLSVEFARDADGQGAAADLSAAFKSRFELTPELEVLAPGTLATEFERAVKAPRFVDRREEAPAP